MSQLRRHDLYEPGIEKKVSNDSRDRPPTHLVDGVRRFKKEYQYMGRSATTRENINETEGVYRAPRNEPYDPSQPRKVPGLKEGGREKDLKIEGVLGDQAVGRPLRSDVMADMMQETSVHPENPPSPPPRLPPPADIYYEQYPA